VDQSRPEWRIELALGPERHALERREVRRPDQECDLIAARRSGLVGVRANRPREHEPGVRRDDRLNRTGHADISRLEVCVQVLRQRDGVARIPGSRDSRWSHMHADVLPVLDTILAMSTFTHDDVERLAALARLELSAAETEMFTRQLSDVLAFVQQIQGVDTASLGETSPVDGEITSLREDVVLPCLERADVLAAAPEPDLAGGLFKVPRVLNG
jgi:aspartyl-tRNA(Asn)/glutamyl-tRNA(Gln) amidotransferase subunit C